ncbi:MAG: Lpg1974 family pore-forming outer membrane protein [Parachlamydiales bacterium]
MGVGTLASLQASSYNNCGSCCNPCCDPCPSWCCGSFEVGGQWIYLRPTSCDFDFVIKDPRTLDTSVIVDSVTPTNWLGFLPQGKSHGIDPDYESGFRVSLGYIMDCSCYDVRVEYTYLHPCDRSRVYGDALTNGLWPTYMHPRYSQNLEFVTVDGNNTLTTFETPIFSGTPSITDAEAVDAFAWSSVKFDYDAVDLQFGSRGYKSNCLWLRTYAGLHFMNLDHRHKAHYRGVFWGVDNFDDGDTTDAFNVAGLFDTFVKWTKNTWGIGPLFGLDARYEVACGFGIGGHFGAAILAGETDGKMFEHDTRNFSDGQGILNRGDFSGFDIDETLDVRHDHRNLLFPYLRASLGVNYLWCCGDCLKVLVEVGYEFNSYINTIGQFRFNDERGTGMANCYSFNLDGIYVSVRATI